MALTGHGIVLQRGTGTGTPETFETIAEITDCGSPQKTAEDIEVTHTQSPNKYKQYVQGLREGGEVALECNWLPGDQTHTHIDDDFESGTIHNYKIEMNNTPMTTIAFTAYVKGIGPRIDRAGKVSATFTFKVTGRPTITTAAA